MIFVYKVGIFFLTKVFFFTAMRVLVLILLFSSICFQGFSQNSNESSGVKYINGKYDGGYDANGKRKGFGRATVTGGSSYEGNWDNDMRNGNGKATFPNGEQYNADNVKVRASTVGAQAHTAPTD